MAQRDAVILLSALHTKDIGESVDLAAARFVSALEGEAQTVAATFMVENARDEDYGSQTESYRTRIVTVCRQEPGGLPPEPLFDLYGFDYRKTLIGDLENKRPVHHLWSTFLILALNAPKLLFSVRQRSKRSAEKWQVRLGWLLYAVLFLYFLTIVGAVAGTLVDLAASDGAAVAAPTVDAGQVATPPAGAVDDATARLATRMAAFILPFTGFMQMIVIWVTAIGLFLKVDLKAWIRDSGLGITVASQYLSLDRRRQTIEGQFIALLNHIGESPSLQYRRVHVVSYSIGSIIALDALFPSGRPAAVFRGVSTLVTIGCPFDFIRTYWPPYFKNRTQLPSVPATWINIYAPADVLGSDFFDLGKTPEEPEPCGITLDGQSAPRRPDVNEQYGRSTTLDQHSLAEKVGFLGFRMHRQYWEGTGAGCYRNVVRAMYGNEAALL